MTNIILWIHNHLSVGRTWIITTILLVLGVVSISRITYDEDINAFLPHDEMTERYAEAYSSIGGGSRILVMLEGAPLDTMLMAIDEFDQAWPNHAQHASEEEDGLELMQFVRTHAAYLLLEEDYKYMDSLLAVDGIADSSMVRIKSQLSTPMGAMTASTLQGDPLALYTPIMRRMLQMQKATNFKMIDGWLVSNDERRAMFWMDSPYGMSETQRNALLADTLYNVTDSIAALHDGLTISAIGAPLIAVGNARQIRTDGMIAISLSVFLIIALLLIRFGSLRPLLWSALALLFGWVMALGTMALLVPKVSLIVLGVGSVVVGLAVDYPLHYICHYRHSSTPRHAVHDLVRPMFTGCVTTIGSFLCLLLLKSEALHHLGIFASLMLGFTLLFSLVLLPVIYTAPELPQTAEPIAEKNATAKSYRHKGLIFLVFCITTICLWLAGRNATFDSNLTHINYVTSMHHLDMARLDSLRPDRAENGQTMLFAVAEGRNADDALRNNDALMERLGTNSMWLPGPEEQQRRLERWNMFWDEHRDSVLGLVYDAAARSGFATDAFSPFVEDIRASHDVLPAEDFGIVMRTLCAANIMRSDTFCRITTFCPMDSVPADMRDMNTATSYVFTSEDVSGRLANLLNDNFNVVGVVCSLMVFLCLWLSFKKVEWAIVAFLPLAASWIWILGLMNIIGWQFNIVNVILATFIFGQGADYAVFVTDGLLTRYRTGRDTLSGYRQAIILLALTTLFGIGTLIVARHPALYSLGVVALLGMLVVVLLCLYLPPVVFGWMTQGREEPVTLMRFVRSLYAGFVFLSGIVLLWPVLLWMRFVGRGDEQHRLRFHKVLCLTARFVINHVPAAPYRVENLYGEDFSHPALIICNHQSQLDLMAVLALTPKLIVLTKEWVWNNPLYASFIHFAEYYPMSRGVDEVMNHVRSLMERGYSVVVFPEGTRSPNRTIGRFHKGAFMMACELQCDVVELMIHGLGHVLPKKDLMLRKGEMSMRVLRRFQITTDDDARVLTRNEHRRYIELYEAWCQEKGYR